jgi:hypothetical protein
MKSKRIRAITTRYKGFAFRSRLEARWAVYFDHMGIRWEYEPEGFELGNGLRYLPDFWLPDFKLWVEIKPTAPDDVGIEKATRLAENHFAVLILCGMPRADESGVGLFFGWDCGESSAGFAAGRRAGHFAELKPDCPAFQVHGSSDRIFFAQEYKHPLDTFDRGDPVCWRRAQAAVEAARSARFEFGAKGAQ